MSKKVLLFVVVALITASTAGGVSFKDTVVDGEGGASGCVANGHTFSTYNFHNPSGGTQPYSMYAKNYPFPGFNQPLVWWPDSTWFWCSAQGVWYKWFDAYIHHDPGWGGFDAYYRPPNPYWNQGWYLSYPYHLDTFCWPNGCIPS